MYTFLILVVLTVLAFFYPAGVAAILVVAALVGIVAFLVKAVIGLIFGNAPRL